MESRQLFSKEVKDKLLFSNIKIDPSISPFVKNRIEIISSSRSYIDLLSKIEKLNIQLEGFNVEYLILHGDLLKRTQRREKMKEIGYPIEGEPDFDNPLVTYSLSKYDGMWYFGYLVKQNTDWLNHKKKPCSFSNSICMHIAKSLVTISSRGDKGSQLLDVCCGVGTIMLEGCSSGFKIEGSDINLKACQHTRKNLLHYNYTAKVYHSDIKDIQNKYDAAIIDLPYNLYSYSNETITESIIQSTAKITNRLVIVSISNIEEIIISAGLKVYDYCTVEKRGKSTFTRKIWVCEKDNSVQID